MFYYVWNSKKKKKEGQNVHTPDEYNEMMKIANIIGYSMTHFLITHCTLRTGDPSISKNPRNMLIKLRPFPF